MYTYGNSLLRRNSEYPLYDGHGSERTVTASNQSVGGAINYEAFGQTAGTTGSSSSPYMYAGAWGYRTDGDAGLMHVGARYYDAQVGRFITRDTVLSEHPYLYCEHDAVNAVDPSGHIWWETDIGCIGDRASGIVRILPGGTAAVFSRSALIEILVGVAAIRAALAFRDWMGREHQPPDSVGGLYGNWHRHQYEMMEYWSDPGRLP